MRFLMVLGLALVLISIGEVSCQKLMMIGGGDLESTDDIFSSFIALATPASGQPYIGICTAASESAEENGQYYLDIFKNEYNVSNAVWIPITLERKSLANSSSMVALMQNMTGIFFGGGDQSYLKTVFNNTITLELMQTNFKSGQLAIGGTSAGCAILQSSPMVTGGESYNALMYGAYDTLETEHPDDLSYEKTGGLGFFTQAYLDTHFGTRGREGRLIQLIGQLYSQRISTQRLGLGIDESTAVKVNGSNLQVLGSKGVYLIDMTQASSTRTSTLWQNVIVNYLTVGDQLTINNNSYTIKFASYKQNIAGHESYNKPMSTSYDIFSSPDNYDSEGRLYPNEFTIVTKDLWDSYGANSTVAYTYEDNPSLEVQFEKSNGSSFYGNYQGNLYISYKGLKTTIVKDSRTVILE